MILYLGTNTEKVDTIKSLQKEIRERLLKVMLKVSGIVAVITALAAIMIACVAPGILKMRFVFPAAAVIMVSLIFALIGPYLKALQVVVLRKKIASYQKLVRRIQVLESIANNMMKLLKHSNEEMNESLLRLRKIQEEDKERQEKMIKLKEMAKDHPGIPELDEMMKGSDKLLAFITGQFDSLNKPGSDPTAQVLDCIVRIHAKARAARELMENAQELLKSHYGKNS